MKENINTDQTKKQYQAGFTLIELGIVLVVIGILATVVYNLGDSAKGAVAHAQVKEETKAFFPIAIQNCLNRVRGDLSSCDTAKILTVSISPLVSTITPCGDTWAAVATEPSVVVTYPLDSCVDADSFGDELATDVSILHKVVASYDASDDDLTITYSR